MKKTCLLVMLAAVSGRAAWYGAVGKATERDGQSIEFVYDAGYRTLEDDADGSEQKMSSHRLVLQYARGLGQGFEMLVRGTPLTSRVNFDGSSLNPDVWSVGGGIHWAPPESLGPLRVGLLATVDYYDGRESEKDNFNWVELGMGAGATYPLPHDLNVTGGVSMLKADINRETSGVKTDYGLAQEVGGFAGAGWEPNEAWNVSTEIHFGNEKIWGLSARYTFQ
ncbi:MAG: hypothetical protein KBD85_03955 [Elusimicrobia bacterium]|nr:hypothetical protein [Elusimicrobiota bacterium]MBP9699153.1 hypothetical protein [Elusimicrobiota bacterium]